MISSSEKGKKQFYFDDNVRRQASGVNPNSIEIINLSKIAIFGGPFDSHSVASSQATAVTGGNHYALLTVFNAIQCAVGNENKSKANLACDLF